ncbi:MAG: hypothetical protein L6R38_002437 [Xanthoria sp. 2 TBL-2021]|nr:MAG: hypothetical protein L6R38_002437 [Xanthoria sp. 2 TBL-2021]
MGEFTGVDRYTFHVSAEGNHCVLRELEGRKINNDEAQEQVIVVGSLQTLNFGAAGPMAAIPVSADHDFTALNVYTRIQPVSLAFARDFGFKKDVAAEAPFRLIHQTPALEDLPRHGRPPSFIALSYCWHNPQWALDGHPVDTLPARAVNFSWPISKWMVQSLLLERISANEGIWIDQCCINQDDPLEKARTIGFMNLIYEQARLVVVVLEDVMIDAADGALLETLMQKCSSQGSPEANVLLESASVHHVVRLALKIFSARWFTRAWCNHELLVSRNHIFLMGVSTAPEDSPRILRMTLLFLSSLILVCSSYDYTGAKDLYHSELMEQYQKLRQRGFLHIVLNPFGLGAGYNLGNQDSDYSTVPYMKSPVETLRNLSKFGATVAADKVAIALNIVGCGLYYSGPDRTEHDCGLLLSVVALAAGDPTVLCCSGPGYNLPGDQQPTSWIQQPRQLDFAGVAGRKGTHRRLDYVPAFTLDQVELDLIYLASNTDSTLRRASEPFIAKAQWFIDGCMDMSKTDAMFQLGASFIQARATKIEVVACALECGPRWIDEAARAKTSADYPNFDLEEAIRVFFSGYEKGHSFPALTEQHRDSYEQLTDFLETLTLDYVSPLDNTLNWTPAWLSIGPMDMDRILFMCPPLQAQPFTAMTPTLLLHKEYTDCKRLFLLSPFDAAAPDTWTVLGKSLVFGGDLDVLTLESSRLRKGQLIKG